MLLFIYGPDTYRAREKVVAIKKQYEARNPGSFALYEFDWGESPDFGSLKGVLDAAGFFAAHKLIVVKDVFRAPPDTLERLKTHLKEVGVKKRDDMTLLLWHRGDLKAEGALKAEKAKTALLWFKRNAVSEEYAPLTGDAFARWAKRELQAAGSTLTAKAFGEFCRMYEGNAWRAVSEIEKLALGHPFTPRYKTHAEIFDLVRALWRRDQKGALQTLLTLLESGTNGFYILAMMAYAVRKSLERASPESGYRGGALREREANGLTRHLQLVADTDLKIKTGELDLEFGLELLAIRLTN
jgi:DNA polymerase III delta subunit